MIEHIYRHLIIPGFESVVKRRNTFSHWRELEESQWWSAAELEQWQVTRLRELLLHSQHYSPWYRRQWAEHGIDIRHVNSLHELAELPVMTRQMMRDHASLIRPAKPHVKFVSKATGGSSGAPLQFVIEMDANDRRVAATFRGYGWAGAGPGTRQSHLWGVNLGEISKWRRWKDHFYAKGLYRRDVLNSFELSQSNVLDYVNRLNRYRPKTLVAYTNPLYFLARAIQEQGIQVHSPHSIIVGSEKLHDFQRLQIEQSFQSKVFETYGSREFTLIGAECDQHGGLHLSSENLIVEVVDDDGRPTPRGDEGQVVVTDLFNTAMPFIRYAIGDRAVAGFDQCDCGRGLPKMKQIVGRQMDMLWLPDGRTLPGHLFPHLLKDFPPILQFQVVQVSPRQIQLSVVVDHRWGKDIEANVYRRIVDVMGRSSQFQIIIVDRIELSPAGKMRVVIGYDDAGRTAKSVVGKRAAG